VIFAEDVHEVIPVDNPLILRDFEDDVAEWHTDPAGGFKGAPNAVLGLVDRTRDEVDRDAGWLPGGAQPGGKFNGPDSAGLVEGVFVLVIDQGEHRWRRLLLGTPDKCFMRENLSTLEVDDGLEGHGESKRQALLFAAATAASHNRGIGADDI
jgi:hypothetical protein